MYPRTNYKLVNELSCSICLLVTLFSLDDVWTSVGTPYIYSSVESYLSDGSIVEPRHRRLGFGVVDRQLAIPNHEKVSLAIGEMDFKMSHASPPNSDPPLPPTKPSVTLLFSPSNPPQRVLPLHKHILAP